MGREGHCKQAPLARVGALAIDGPHGVATPKAASTSQIQAAEVPWWAVRAQFHLLRGTGLRCDTPGRSQEGMVSDWRPPHSLVGDAVSGAEMAVAPCLPPLAVMHLPLCLQGGLQMAADSPLFGILQGRILCSMSVPGVTVQH